MKSEIKTKFKNKSKVKSSFKLKKTKKKTKDKNKKYYYIIQSKLLLEDKYKNTTKMKIFLSKFKERGNWEEFDIKNPQQESPDFIYMDADYNLDKSFWVYKPTLVSYIDIRNDNYSISNKYNLIENLKTTDINKKHLLNQIYVNIYDIFMEKNKYYNIYQKWFDKYKVLIFKPISGIRGENIEVFKNFNTFKKFIYRFLKKKYHRLKNFDIEKYNKMGVIKQYLMYNIEWVLQEYIDNPLLYQGLKFHLRGYFVYHYLDGVKKGYLLNNTTIFTAKEKYKKDDYQNKFIHDTHAKYTLKDIAFYDDISNIIGKENADNIFNQIIHIFKNVFKIINSKCYLETKNCFNIFGFDAIITDDFTVKIIETNRDSGTPRIELFDEIMEKIIDYHFPPLIKQPATNNFIEL